MDVLSLKTNNHKQHHSEPRGCLAAAAGVKLLGSSPSLHPREVVPAKVQPLCVEPAAGGGYPFLLCSPLRVLSLWIPAPISILSALGWDSRDFLSTPVSIRFTEKLLGSSPGCLCPVCFRLSDSDLSSLWVITAAPRPFYMGLWETRWGNVY